MFWDIQFPIEIFNLIFCVLVHIYAFAQSLIELFILNFWNDWSKQQKMTSVLNWKKILQFFPIYHKKNDRIE